MPSISQQWLVLMGGRDQQTGLWKLSVNPVSKPTHAISTISSLDLHMLPNQSINHLASNVYTLTYKQTQIKHMHQSFSVPPIATLIYAIQNDQLEGIPFMKADLVQNYLLPLPAMYKGRTKLQRCQSAIEIVPTSYQYWILPRPQGWQPDLLCTLSFLNIHATRQ